MLGWVDQTLYENYHRLVTHSLPGLVAVVLLAATLARLWPERLLLSFMVPRDAGPRVDPAWRRLLGFASVAVTWHWVGDWIAGWGVWPLWPWLDLDVALRRVNSLEPILFGLTLTAFLLQQRLLRRGGRRAAWLVAGTWLASCVLYVWLRPRWGAPPIV